MLWNGKEISSELKWLKYMANCRFGHEAGDYTGSKIMINFTIRWIIYKSLHDSAFCSTIQVIIYIHIYISTNYQVLRFLRSANKTKLLWEMMIIFGLVTSITWLYGSDAHRTKAQNRTVLVRCAFALTIRLRNSYIVHILLHPVVQIAIDNKLLYFFEHNIISSS
jgi:hypothetical protein